MTPPMPGQWPSSAPSVGQVVLDVACGTGRALPWLRAAVGPGGTVVGLDVTVEMLGEAARRGRADAAGLVLADAICLPFTAAGVDRVFAAGLLPHLPDPVAGLSELARICRPGARLALFHPIGRAALARRHGHEPAPDDIRAPARIRVALAAAGWDCERVTTPTIDTSRSRSGKTRCRRPGEVDQFLTDMTTDANPDCRWGK